MNQDRVDWERINEAGCMLDLQRREGKRKTSWRVRFTPESGAFKGKRQIVLVREKNGSPIRSWVRAQKLAFEAIALCQARTEDRPRQASDPQLLRAEDLIEELIESKRPKADGTYQDIRYYCRTYIIPYFNDHCPYACDFTQYHWDGTGTPPEGRRRPKQFLDWFNERFPGYSIFNVKKYLSMCLKKFRAANALHSPVKLHLSEKRVSPGQRRTPQEIRELIEATYSLKNPYALNMRTAILMGAHLGMRRSEITKLQKDRVDLVRKEIALRAKDTKTRKPREFVISDAVYFCLKQLFEAHPNSPYVFPNRDDPSRPMNSFKVAWTKVRAMTGIQCRFHDLRHTFLSEALLTHKMDPLKVAVFAGVSLHVIETVYLHPKAEDTQEVMRVVSHSIGGEFKNAI